MKDDVPPASIRTRRKQVRAWMTACIALLLAACSSAPTTPAARVEVTRHASSMPGPRYAWVESPKVLDAESDARVLDPQFRQRLQAALDKALQAKGYHRVGMQEQPDFLAAYRVGLRDVEQTTQSEDSDPIATPETAFECRDGYCSQIVMRGNDNVPVVKFDTTRYTQGGLLVELLNPANINVLWSAIDKGTVKPGVGDQARLDEIARQILAQLPAVTP